MTSRPGAGSTFWVRLPLPLDPEGAPGPLPQADLRGLRVLIVDDHALNRRVLHEQLTSGGLRPAEVASGEAALTALRQAHATGDPYPIAVLDAQMPGMDGETLGRTIKADPALRDTLLVMLTSVGQQGDARRMHEAGFAAYLVKPVRPWQLLDTLAAVWGARTQGIAPTFVTRHTLAEAPADERPAAPRADRAFRARVLVAEDNVMNQRLAVRMLEKLGCRVDVAANGYEAVQMLEQLTYDLIMMDCQMPEMGGYEATQAIREREARTGGHLPIVAMTANAMQGNRERCLAAGMDDYIAKPVRADDLVAVLERWAEKAGTEPGGTAGEWHAAARGETPERPPTLDPAVVASLREVAGEGDESFLAPLVETFLRNTTDLIAALRHAASTGDAHSLERAAHTLKGSSSTLGAGNLATLCHQLQTLGQSQSVAGAGAVIDQVEQEFARVRGELNAQFRARGL